MSFRGSSTPGDWGPLVTSSHSRRDVLKYSLAGAATVGLGGLLSACGSSSSGGSPSSTATAAAGTPKRGGTLRAGLSTGSSSDALSGINPLDVIDFARAFQIWDPLVAFDENNNVQMVLADEITPNGTATEWTIRLKSGITWHDGKPLTADDVMYTLQAITNPKNASGGQAGLSLVDGKNIKKLDTLTLRVPMKGPFAVFPETLCNYYFQVIQAGSPVGSGAATGSYVAKHPVGTGPFEYVSFKPGVQSVFKRNNNYWQSGLPYVDELIISDIGDESSQVNALLSDQVDAVNLLSAASAAEVRSGGGQVVVGGGGFTPFTMRVDRPPFNDVRVRQAMRLAINRPQMLQTVFGGSGGQLGNDYPDIYDPDYNHALPQRHQDIDQAKSLLRQAGQENLKVTLDTSPVAEGLTSAAQVLKQQVQAAGISVAINQVTPAQFYGPQFLSWGFAQDQSFYSNYLFLASLYKVGSLSPYNECHFNDPQYNKLYKQALSTVNGGSRRNIILELQKIEYERGGWILPYYPPVIDGISKRLKGVKQTKTGLSLGSYDFKSMWLD